MSKHIAEFKGQDLVHRGVIYRGSDQIGKLCRVLKEGYLEVYRDTKLVGYVENVAGRAKMALYENDKGFRYVKYKPSPFAKEKQ